jgi:Protein of unknown function (DUF2510)
MNSPAPGWLPDPTTRHQYRYWDGNRWTDDVADAGVASTDALGEPGPASDPNPTAADPTQQVDATREHPGAGQQPTASTPYHGDYYGSGQAPPAPARKRPPAGLIAALAVLAVALIGGLVYFLVRDDGSSDDASEISDEDSTTTEPDNPDDNDSNDGSNSGGGDDSGSGDTTLPDDIDSENVDQLVEIMADNMEQASGGALSHEEATCISEGFLDELGLERLLDIGESGENPFIDPEMTSQLFSIMEDCGVSLEDLATAPD